MGTAIVIILVGFVIAAAVLALVIVRLDRTVRQRYRAPGAESPQASGSPPREPEL